MAQSERGDEQAAKAIPTVGTDHEVHDRSPEEATADQGDRIDLLRRVALAEAERAQGQAREAALAARLIDAESDLARLVALEAEARRAVRAERMLRDLTGSASWRLTRPLRAARTAFRGRAR